VPYPSLKLVEETIEKQLDSQIKHIDSLDTKTGVLLGFLAVALASVLASKDVAEVVAKSNLLKVAVAAFLIAFLLALAAFAVREYRRDPNPRQLRLLYPAQPEERTRFDLSDSYVVSFEHNASKLESKVRLLRGAITLAGLDGLGFASHTIFGW